MGRFILILLAIITLGSVFFFVSSPHSETLVINVPNKRTLPRIFRYSGDHISASCQFSEKGLKEIIATIPSKNLIILDLREEPHGFVNGHAISWRKERNWMNIGKTAENIEENEVQRLKKLKTQKLAILRHKKGWQLPRLVMPNEVMTERALADSLGIRYLRMPITDHVKPTDSLIDEFVEFFVKMEPADWVHVHCSAGKGRTSTILAMYDMLTCAHVLSFETIIQKQKKEGRIDLMALPSEKKWKSPYFIERQAFLREFYAYCKEQGPIPLLSWSEWKRENRKAN